VENICSSISHTQGDATGKYVMLHIVGESAVSVTKKVTHRSTGESFAIKAEVKMMEAAIWEELAILRKLAHENIVKLHETFEDSSHICSVLEFCAGGPLSEVFVDRESALIHRDNAAAVMRQMAASIEYIHGQGICHRAIQPDHFLLKEAGSLCDAIVKLIDFTTARNFMLDNSMRTKTSSSLYSAPEMLSPDSSTEPYSEKVDVWSLGVLFYVICCGSPPFNHDGDVGISSVSSLSSLSSFSLEFSPPELWSDLSSAQGLILAMLSIPVSDRASAKQVIEHPYLKR